MVAPLGLTLAEAAAQSGNAYSVIQRANAGAPVTPKVIRRLRAWLIAEGEDPAILRAEVVVRTAAPAAAGQ
jgi:hypothetical protein